MWQLICESPAFKAESTCALQVFSIDRPLYMGSQEWLGIGQKMWARASLGDSWRKKILFPSQIHFLFRAKALTDWERARKYFHPEDSGMQGLLKAEGRIRSLRHMCGHSRNQTKWGNVRALLKCGALKKNRARKDTNSV